jgi:prophage regulatory protein
MANVILRIPTVKARTGLSRSSIYQRVTDGSFPRPISLGARAVGWVESEIEGWISQKITESRGSRPAKPLRGALMGTTAGDYRDVPRIRLAIINK